MAKKLYILYNIMYCNIFLIFMKRVRGLGGTNKKISLKYFIPIFIIIYYSVVFMSKENIYIQKLASDLLGISGSFIAFIVLFNVYRNTVKSERYYWFFLSLGIFSYTIAEMCRAYYDLILKTEAPILGIHSIFYLLQYPLSLFGILYIISKRRNKMTSLKLFFDNLIIFTMVFTLALYYHNMKVSFLNSMDLRSFSVIMGYIIKNLNLFFSVLFLYFAVREVLPKKVAYIGASGFLLETVMDVIYIYMDVFGITKSLIYYKTMWILPLLVIAFSGEIFEDVEMIPRRKYRRENVSVILSAYIGIVIFLIVTILKAKKMDVIFLGFLITGVFIAIRQSLTVIENYRLVNLLIQSNEELKINKMELENANKELQRFYRVKDMESKTDFLTGLYNRRYIDEKIEEISLKCQGLKNNISVLMLDIDHFKGINDTYGHGVGDMILKEISKIMKNNTRSDDILIRFGGEEFVCLLPNTDVNTAKKIAERLRSQVENNNFRVWNFDISVTISIGVSQIDEISKNSDISSVIIEADKALYEAKKCGRNRVACM
ncbi:MAG: Diguanylate cyclase (GGDEF) domain-containing protein [Sporanaerobacter sp.]|jgi:diguanylate cyclase (GGDEF)-like protein